MLNIYFLLFRLKRPYAWAGHTQPNCYYLPGESNSESDCDNNINPYLIPIENIISVESINPVESLSLVESKIPIEYDIAI